MTTTTENNNNKVATTLIPVADIQALVTTAPEALDRNSIAVERINQTGSALLAKMAANGMSPELDAEMNNYMVRVRTAKEEMENRRKPLTQFLDRVRGAFTTMEGQVDKDKAGTVPFQIQQARNEYVKFVAEEARKAEELRRIKAAQDQERINLAAGVERRIRELFVLFLNTELQRLQALFSQATLDNLEANRQTIAQASTTYPHGHFSNAVPSIEAQIVYNDKSIGGGIISGVLESGLYDQLLNEFREAVEERKSSLAEMFPGKKEALLQAAKAAQEARAAEIARAQAEEDARKASTAAEAAAAAAAKEKADQEAKMAAERAEQLQAEEKEREIIQQRKMAAEAATRDQEAANEIEARKSAAEANSLFDQTLEAQLDQATTAGRSREGYEIEIKAPAAWLQVFQLWYQLEGSKLALDKFEKKTLGSMLKACEKHAHKTGEKIESKLLVYKETFKAVNTK